MLKALLKSPFLILSLIVFALAGCSDQSQNSAEQTADETVDQIEEAVTEETGEITTQD